MAVRLSAVVAVKRRGRDSGDRAGEAERRKCRPAGRWRVGTGHDSRGGNLVLERQRVRGGVAAVSPLLADVADVERGNRRAGVVRQSGGLIHRTGRSRRDRPKRAIRQRIGAGHPEAVERARVRRAGAGVVGRARRVPAGNRRVVHPRIAGAAEASASKFSVRGAPSDVTLPPFVSAARFTSAPVTPQTSVKAISSAAADVGWNFGMSPLIGCAISRLGNGGRMLTGAFHIRMSGPHFPPGPVSCPSGNVRFNRGVDSSNSHHATPSLRSSAASSSSPPHSWPECWASEAARKRQPRPAPAS